MKLREIYYTQTFKKSLQKLPKDVQREAIKKEKTFLKDDEVLFADCGDHTVYR